MIFHEEGTKKIKWDADFDQTDFPKSSDIRKRDCK